MHKWLRIVWTERFLISALLAIELCYFGILIAAKRFPAGHDGLQYWMLQYYFLNDNIYSHQLPQWLPFLTQGTVASWWYALQASFLQNALCLWGPSVKHINFFYIYYANMWVDECFLLAGCWLWGRLLLNNPVAVFFFTASVFGSTIWFSQSWYNFHYYYCLPLIFYFFHRFIDTSQWRYFFLGGQLTAMQLLGGLPYMLPLSTLIIFLYFFFFSVTNFDHIRSFAQRLRWGLPAFLSLISIIALFYAIRVVLNHGTAEILNYNTGRNFDGTTSLKDFLTYATNLNFHKWKELFLGVGPELDYNLYGGILLVPMCVWTLLFSLNRKTLPFILTAVVLADFSVGGITATFFYTCWPFMKYYRHLALISASLKIFVYLTAAFAVKWFAERSLQPEQFPLPKAGLKQSVPMLVLGGIVLWHLTLTTGFIYRCLSGMIPDDRFDLTVFYERYQPFVLDRLHVVVILAAVMFLLLFLWKNSSPKRRPLLLAFILAVHIGDVYSYKLHESRMRSMPVKDALGLLQFQPVPFGAQRTRGAAWNETPRILVLEHSCLFRGVEYWSNDLFFFHNTVDHSWRVDHWLKPLDQLMRTYWGQDIDNINIFPIGLGRARFLKFPLDHPGARNFAAFHQDKVQVFSDVLYAEDIRAVSKLIASKEYQGNIPVLTGNSPAPPQDRLGENTRMEVPIYLKKFTSNELRAEVKLDRPGWFFYSDVWHPLWKATVNGKEAEIRRANLAYKIIPVPAGKSDISFKFYSTKIHALQIIFSILSLLWILVIAYILRRELGATHRIPNYTTHA